MMASSIVVKNNAAVALLQKKECTGAVNMFKAAVDALHVISTSHDERDLRDAETKLSSSSTLKFHFKPLRPVCNQLVAFVYQRAVYISEASVRTEAQRTRLSAVVLYNMALSYHIGGLENGNTGALQMSIQMYEMARSLLYITVEQEEESMEENNAADIFHLAMAILNNMGQLFYELSEYESSRECIKQVRCILEQSRNSYTDSESQEIFELNATAWEISSHASAA